MNKLLGKIQLSSLLPSPRVFKVVDLIAFLFVIVWALYVMWQIYSGSTLATVLPSTTQIHIDLLQSFAFLLAWTIFVLTITVRILNKAWEMQMERLIESHAQNLARTEQRLRFEQHLEEHPDVEGAVASLESKVDTTLKDAAAEIDRLRDENAELRRENEQVKEAN